MFPLAVTNLIETGIPGTVAAVPKAIHRGTGGRVRSVPITINISRDADRGCGLDAWQGDPGDAALRERNPAVVGPELAHYPAGAAAWRCTAPAARTAAIVG